MKIVDRKTFLSLPAETLFSKYEPCWFDALMIKGDTIGTNDFCYQQIADAVRCNNSREFADILFDAAENGTSFNLDLDCHRRDGCFDDGQLFAVWDASDVAALIKRLTRLVGLNEENEKLRQALLIAAAAIEIADDWNLSAVQVEPPKEWSLDGGEEDPADGWCSTMALAKKLRELARGEGK